MTQKFQVTMFLNVNEDMSFFLYGLRPKDPIAEVDTFQFNLNTTNVHHVAEYAWSVGNKVCADDFGKAYPIDVRSLSVGDMVKIVDEDGNQTFLAVDNVGWRDLIEPTNPIVPIEGTRATSRKN
jgi:hypothetical protein